MILSMEREIFKYSRVYNLNNDINEPYMKISLTYNSVTDWLDSLLPIMSHKRSVMVITQRWTGLIPVLDSLGFTVNTVYYGGIF